MLYVLLILFVGFLDGAFGFNLGYSPTFYGHGEKVDLLVNKIESDHTQLPYGYYDLPFVCPNSDAKKRVHLSFGEILKGERYLNSNYELEFGIDRPCVRLCDLIVKGKSLKMADSLIKNGYVVHWSLDGLPGATTFVSGKNKYYAAGFPMGFVKDEISYIYNHVMLVIRYHRDKSNSNLNTIVGFEVYPKSVINEECPGSSKSYKNFPLTVKKTKDVDLTNQKVVIPYTYAVYWREDKSVDYESRWDLYYENEMNKPNQQIHWFAITNAFVLFFLVSLIVAVVLMKSLKKDIRRSTPPLPINNMNSNLSWKELLERVFDRPLFSTIMSILVASGIQVLVSAVGVLLIFVINTKFSLGGSSSISFFNNHQGTLFSFLLFHLIISGILSSYFGLILHKLFNNVYLNSEYNSKKCAVLSIFFSGFLPAFVLSVTLLLNFFLWAKRSSNALPFGTIIVLIFLLGVEIPLGIIGGSLGNKKKFGAKSFLLTTSRSESRSEPKKSKKRTTILLRPFWSIAVFGLIPFVVVYVELLFILNTVWLEKTTFYFMYGFLLLTTIILLLIICESAVVAAYLCLAVDNNPRWHWLCFRVGSSIGYYIYGYSIYYFLCYLHVRDAVSTILYFSYMALACIVVGLGGGAVSIICGLLFIKRIYGLVKED
ncbi:uncharacterized protein PRCAT00001688001 [Priceomyces carsonii]|uniref:uncharacterized protein n=1 Tax=Priceomyces carsonii TaxID=28549 RepID=UPI002EDBA32F|nr:unnamed protein product [Priceomyces carsonii]